MVFERWTQQIVRISHISDDVLLFICPQETTAGENGTIIYFVKLSRFGETQFIKLRITNLPEEEFYLPVFQDLYKENPDIVLGWCNKDNCLLISNKNQKSANTIYYAHIDLARLENNQSVFDSPTKINMKK
jgi:hypothetical protein